MSSVNLTIIEKIGMAELLKFRWNWKYTGNNISRNVNIFSKNAE